MPKLSWLALSLLLASFPACGNKSASKAQAHKEGDGDDHKKKAAESEKKKDDGHDHKKGDGHDH